MLFLFFIVFCIIAGGLCFLRYRHLLQKRSKQTDYNIGSIAFIIIAIILAVASIATSGVAWQEQINDFENIKKFEKVGAIYHVKAEALTIEFSKHLAEEYPKHERDIYEKISPDQVGVYLVKYPELKTSETLMALVEQINKLQSDVYDQQVKSEEALQRTRVRLRNPWALRFMIPTE